MAGLEPAGIRTALAAVLPNATNVYVALMEELPVAGAGGTEATAAGYARVAIDQWTSVDITQIPGGVVRRSAELIDYGTITEDADLAGWAIYDMSTGGDLLASGPFGAIGEEGTRRSVTNGDTVQFQTGTLQVGIGNIASDFVPVGGCKPVFTTDTKTTDYTAARNELVKYDPAGGQLILNAPPSPSHGDCWGIKNTTTDTDQVLIETPGTEQIEGPLTFTLANSHWLSGDGLAVIWQFDSEDDAWLLVQ